MKEHDELISAAESVLGFVFGDKIDCTREHAGLEPMVPLRFREIAAEQVFDRLDKAVRNARTAPSESWWERLARFLLGDAFGANVCGYQPDGDRFAPLPPTPKGGTGVSSRGIIDDY